MAFDNTLYAWALQRYLHAFPESRLRNDLAYFEKHQALFWQLRTEEQRCQTCTSKPETCTGRRRILDIRASRLYDQYTVGTEKCPSAARNPHTILSPLQETGFSPKSLNIIANLLDNSAVDESASQGTNSEVSTPYLPNLETLHPTSLDLTNATQRGKEGGNTPANLETTLQLPKTHPLADVLSTLAVHNLSRDRLREGGIIYPTNLNGYSISNRQTEDSRSKALQQPETGSQTLGSISYGDTYIGLNSYYISKALYRARPRETAAPYPIAFHGDLALIVNEGIHLPALGHWLGVAAALQGIPVGYAHVESLVKGSGTWEDGPLAQFLDFVEEIGVLILLGYRCLAAGRRLTDLMLAALTHFLATEGSLWLVLDAPIEALNSRSEAEVPVLDDILTLPRYPILIHPRGA